MDFYLKCNEQMCDSKEVKIVFLCNNAEHYLCWDHYFNHINSCSYPSHETMPVISPNPEICGRIEDKLNVVFEEAENLIVLINTELKILEGFHWKAWIKALNTRKRLISELQKTKETCNLFIEKLKKPIIIKDYYPPFEYVLINKDPSYSDMIIDQIKPPAIQEIELDQNMWKKISFQSADFTYLLTSYNKYCFALRGKATIAYTDIKGDEKSFENTLIDSSSRFMLISPIKILITGGMRRPESCFILDIEDQSIIEQNSLNNKRFWHCCAFIRGYPAVIGGRIKGENTTENIKAVESFENGVWKNLPSLIHARSSPAVSSLFGKVYVCGGNKFHFCEVFDEEKNIWEEILSNQPPTSSISPGLISIYKDVILIFGGASSTTSATNEAVKFYLSDQKSAEIIPLGKAGKFSWGSHVIKDGTFYSAIYFEQLNEFIKWKLVENISFFE